MMAPYEQTIHGRQNMSDQNFLDVLEDLIKMVVEPAASSTDQTGTFPRSAVAALGSAGLLGLTSVGSRVQGAKPVVGKLVVASTEGPSRAAHDLSSKSLSHHK
jgi:hypothetical protein